MGRPTTIECALLQGGERTWQCDRWMEGLGVSGLTARGIGCSCGTCLRVVSGQTGIHEVIVAGDDIHSHASIAEYLAIVHDENALHRDFIVSGRQQHLPLIAIPSR